MIQPIKLKKLLRVSGITMSTLLPSAVIPRVMQALELDIIEPLVKTPIYTRVDVPVKAEVKVHPGCNFRT